jgi:hypothetical protein
VQFQDNAKVIRQQSARQASSESADSRFVTRRISSAHVTDSIGCKDRHTAHSTQVAVQAPLKVTEEGIREGLERIAVRVRQIASAVDATKADHTTEYARDTAVLQDRI